MPKENCFDFYLDTYMRFFFTGMGTVILPFPLPDYIVGY
ncbi:hypothetical protein HMPREF9303_1268 [Prevotella denticola CRIS 18C-A]|uniref:Uncharacterized protein n=1 Tax=Prevotella denticola CRIS 18C-A TaxID=944557 RepID=F0H740_9BACT|nr:hypothetical protein HMPREF9137_1198 [Prevotella denticola F0289]EGC86364.1 hypothetical protein HMPREF9303_1268 [Prevotella denticola CRIS 18C-A]